MINTTSPRSGWLNKLTTNNAFGTSRWQSRYFVLLDSEMRYYKDEHSVTASRTISLRDVSKVITTSSPNHQYCFKLEPTLYYQNQHPVTAKNQKKIWTMECQSEYELEAWVAAINLRLSKLCFDEEEEEEDQQSNNLCEIVSPTLQPFSTPEQKRQQPLMSLFHVITSTSTISSRSNSTISTEDIDHYYTTTPTPQPRPLKRFNPSISRRRGVILSPLDMCTIPDLESDTLSSSSSRGSSLPSPTRETIIEEIDDDDETMSQQANKVTAHNAYVLDASSPTFALYKERFGL